MRNAAHHTQPLIPPGPLKLGLAEYLELPNDGKRYQILDGVLDVTPAPTPRHQQVSKRLQARLMQALEPDEGEVFNAPIDVVFDAHNIVQPDLLFIRKGRLNIVGPANIQGAPDLVVEILSPSNRRTDVVTKSLVYARFKVTSYWIADPEVDRLELFRLKGGAYKLAATGSLPKVMKPAEFPGLELPLADIFR
jgi:Uma2 family endonuclease